MSQHLIPNLKQYGCETFLRKLFYFKRSIPFVNFFLKGKIIIILFFMENGRPIVNYFLVKLIAGTKCYRKANISFRNGKSICTFDNFNTNSSLNIVFTIIISKVEADEFTKIQRIIVLYIW